MAITIELDDALATALENKARNCRLSVQEFAIDILADAVGDSKSPTPEEVVARIRSTPPNPAAIRRATGNLADALRQLPQDSEFDEKEWARQWSNVESELKSVTRDNDITEGRGG